MDNRERIAELAAKARQGSREAFNELYCLTRDRAYFVAFTITRNEQDALDIVQDSYLKAWQSIGSLQKPEQFPAWLRQITGNTAKNFIKHHSPLLFLQSDDATDDLFDLQEERDDDYIPDAAMDTAETRQLIMNIVDDLPEDQRLCVLMYYYDEMSVGEIAAALDVPAGTVKNRLFAARQKISKGVERLERQGTKLYGAAPIPLMIWLLRGASATSKNFPPAVLGGTAATGGLLAGIGMGKLIAGVTAAVIAVGGTITAATVIKNKSALPAAAEPPVSTAVESDGENDILLASLELPAIESNPGTNAYTQPYTQPVAAAQPASSAFRPAAANTTTASQPVPVTTTTANPPKATTAATTRYVYNAPATTTTTTTTITATTTAETTAATLPPAPQKIIQSSNGVSIEYAPGVLPNDAALEVTIGGTTTTRVVDVDLGIILERYHIKVSQGGTQVQPSGSVIIYLPLPPGYNEANSSALKVQHMQVSGGQLTETNARAVGSTLVFDTTHI